MTTQTMTDPILDLLGPHLRLMKLKPKTRNPKLVGYKAEIRNNKSLIWASSDAETPMSAIRAAVKHSGTYR